VSRTGSGGPFAHAAERAWHRDVQSDAEQADEAFKLLDK
jgi:ATP-dependent protease HslVU (ClpYQ) peptidase subunit